MRFIGKKADKSLQMIFGLFMLLIISLVVLNLFFKFTEKSSTKMEGASTEYFSKAEIQQAIQDCQALCDNINDLGTLMTFCKTYHQIDWNGNQIEGEAISEGKYDFCESKIPCFVLVDDCGQKSTSGIVYDGGFCNATLNNPANGRQTWYDALANDVGVIPAASTPGDGCIPALEDTCANWKCKFGFAACTSVC